MVMFLPQSKMIHSTVTNVLREDFGGLTSRSLASSACCNRALCFDPVLANWSGFQHTHCASTINRTCYRSLDYWMNTDHGAGFGTTTMERLGDFCNKVLDGTMQLYAHHIFYLILPSCFHSFTGVKTACQCVITSAAGLREVSAAVSTESLPYLTRPDSVPE